METGVVQVVGRDQDVALPECGPEYGIQNTRSMKEHSVLSAKILNQREIAAFLIHPAPNQPLAVRRNI